MFFHPDDALSRDELLQKIWRERLTDSARARWLANAEARGCTYMDLLRELAREEWPG